MDEELDSMPWSIAAFGNIHVPARADWLTEMAVHIVVKTLLGIGSDQHASKLVMVIWIIGAAHVGLQQTVIYPWNLAPDAPDQVPVAFRTLSIMKLFSSCTLLLFALFYTVVAIGPLGEPGFITQEDIECSDPMPKYDEKSGRKLDSMGRFLRGDWVRMPHPHNLPRIDRLPLALVDMSFSSSDDELTHLQLPLTSSDFLSFGIIHDQLCWSYMTGHMVHMTKLTLQNAVPYAEMPVHLEFGLVRRWAYTNYEHAGQLAGYWREARNPNRLIRITIVKKKSGEVEFLTRALTKEEEAWTRSARFVARGI